MISAWYALWHAVAIMAPTGNIPPSTFVNTAVSLMILSFNLGGLVQVMLKTSKKSQLERFDINLKQYAKVMLWIIGPIILFFTYRALHIMYQHGYAYLRRNVYSLYDHVSILFGYPEIELLYNLLIKSSILLLVLVLLPQLIKNYHRFKHITLIAIILFFLDEIMKGGRVNYYVLLIVSVSIVLLNWACWDKKLKQIMTISVTTISIFLIISLFKVTEVRGRSPSKAIGHVIDYHIISFTLFDQALAHNRMNINEHTYGRLLFSGGDFMLSLFVRKLGNDDYRRSLESDLTDLQTNFSVTPPEAPTKKEYNAFYGVFYNFYRDLHLFGFILFPFIIGALTNRVFIMFIDTRHNYYLSFLLLLIKGGITSIFQNPLDAIVFWNAGIGIYLLSILPQINFLSLNKSENKNDINIKRKI